MINCAEAVKELWDFLDRTLSSADRDAVDEHLAFCRRCCGELEFARELRQFLATKHAGALPPDVQSRLTRFIAEIDTRGPSAHEA